MLVSVGPFYGLGHTNLCTKKNERKLAYDTGNFHWEFIPHDSLWFFARKINYFFSFVILALRKVCLNSEWRAHYFGSMRAPPALPNWVWRSMNWYIMFFNQLHTNSKNASKTYWTWKVLYTKMGEQWGKNNQLLTKSPIELRENLMAPNFENFIFIKLLLKQLTSHATMNMMFRDEVWNLLACYHEGWPSCQKI